MNLFKYGFKSQNDKASIAHSSTKISWHSCRKGTSQQQRHSKAVLRLSSAYYSQTGKMKQQLTAYWAVHIKDSTAQRAPIRLHQNDHVQTVQVCVCVCVCVRLCVYV